MNNDVFTQYRPFLISMAFRMTGRLSDAEDIVQETLAQYAAIDPSTIENPQAWLVKVCANKALDFLKLAYRKREVYPGTWLPDAVPDSFQILDTPESDLIRSESLTLTFLLMLERQTPEERVVYLLGEIFEYSFREIASLLDKSEEACRKLAQRARKAMTEEKPKFTVHSPDSEKMLQRFFESAKRGDRAELLSLLADDSELWSDGGGKVPVASATVLKDVARIATFFAKLGASPALNSPNIKMDYTSVNLRPGVVISKRLPNGLWSFDTILSFEFQDGRIARIYAQRNPDKLKILERHSSPITTR